MVIIMEYLFILKAKYRYEQHLGNTLHNKNVLLVVGFGGREGSFYFQQQQILALLLQSVLMICETNNRFICKAIKMIFDLDERIKKNVKYGVNTQWYLQCLKVSLFFL